MDKVEQFFRNMSNSDTDYDRLVGQIKDILFGDKSIHILCGNGSNGKTSLVNVLTNILDDRIVRLPRDALCSTVIDSSYIPYIMNCEYILIGDLDSLQLNPAIIKQLLTGYKCQYHKPYTNNWNQVNIIQKRIIIETNHNLENTPFGTTGELNPITNVIKFDVNIQNSDPTFVHDVSNNHHKDVYNYLSNY